jgi:hypothetical protein
MEETIGMVGIPSASAIIDSIGICHNAYREVSIFIRALEEMGHDVAVLQQRFKEEECRMWTFALARNLIVDGDRPVDVVRASIPQFWIEVVDTRFSLVRKHIEVAEKLVHKYCDNVPSYEVKSTTESAEKCMVSFRELPFQTVILLIVKYSQQLRRTTRNPKWHLGIIWKDGQLSHQVF